MRVPLSCFEDCIENDRKLIGGRIRGKKYFIAILDGNNIVEVYSGKLRNNCRSQRSNSNPDGFQPFLIESETWKYDIRTKTLEVRRIYSGKSLAGKLYVNRILERKDARILKIPVQGSERFLWLQKRQCRTLVEEQLRRTVSVGMENLNFAADLLQEAVLGARPASSDLIQRLDDRFELYVRLAPNKVLQHLLSLLQDDADKSQSSKLNQASSAFLN
jgi:hypothetical protein